MFSSFGSSGIGNGQFAFPQGIVLDANGNIYVADTLNNRVQKFDSNGNYLLQWGISGSGNGQFNQPIGIAVDENNNIYVVDYGNSRIQKFDSFTNYVKQWGLNGINAPIGIAVGKGNVYVTGNDQKVWRFDVNGNILSPPWVGGFNIWGISLDVSGNVYVVDHGAAGGGSKVQKFDPSGNFIFQIRYGDGNGNGQFNSPTGIAVALSGNIYVIDAFNNRIEKFDSNGNYALQWGQQGNALGQYRFLEPGLLTNSLALDKSENIYVTDTSNNRIEKTIYPYVFSNLNVLGIYPTPVRSRQNANIAFHLNNAGSFTITIRDFQGSSIVSYQGQANQGDNILQWNLVSTSGSVIDPGTYFVTLQSGSTQATQDLVYLP